VGSSQAVTSESIQEEEEEQVMRKIRKKKLLIGKGYGFPGENICIYKREDGQWKRRKDISELRIGQRLFASRLPQSDLLNGKTGAKVFFECGVGTYDDSSGWSIINGMMRVGGRETKNAVVQKRLKRLKTIKNLNFTLFEVYVSRIRLPEKRFEVLPTYEEAMNYEKVVAPRRIPISSLQPGQELVGKIIRVEPYGAIIDVGANKYGLLHIKTVAKLTGTKDVYQPNGLKEFGIVRNAQVRVSVLSNGYKQYKNSTSAATAQPNTKGKWARQLELDFTKEAREEAERDQQEAREKVIEERRARWESRRGIRDRQANLENTSIISPELSATVTAAEEEEADDYDEDRELEDTLGLDCY
jgi:predicted RNA-binding protein with RPS1 domain